MNVDWQGGARVACRIRLPAEHVIGDADLVKVYVLEVSAVGDVAAGRWNRWRERKEDEIFCC